MRALSETFVQRVPDAFLRFRSASEDTIRIMLATDNHIGYNERDPIRGQDSINTFREILQLAVKHDVSRLMFSNSA